MTCAVVLTFPGHFFLTKLTIESIKRHYSDVDSIFVMFDDVVAAAWPQYVSDASEFYSINKEHFIPFSATDKNISHCKIGWYRQQFAKCCVDKFVNYNDIFLVDGDIIFDERIETSTITPVQHRNIAEEQSAESIIRGVTTLLGIKEHPILLDNQYRITSPIPFRHLNKQVLRELRSRVEQNIHADFVIGLTNLIHSQDIVVNDVYNNKIILHEWELIEAVKQIQHPGKYTIKDIGAGYPLAVNTENCMPARFRHGFTYDYALGVNWLEQELGCKIDQHLWTKTEMFNEYFTKVKNTTL